MLELVVFGDGISALYLIFLHVLHVRSVLHQLLNNRVISRQTRVLYKVLMGGVLNKVLTGG